MYGACIHETGVKGQVRLCVTHMYGVLFHELPVNGPRCTLKKACNSRVCGLVSFSLSIEPSSPDGRLEFLLVMHASSDLGFLNDVATDRNASTAVYCR